MTIKSVELASLPRRTKSYTDEDRATAAAIVKAGANGKYATDGETHKTRGEANAAASQVKRMLIALGSVPAGQEVTISVRGDDKTGYTWYLTFRAAPEQPRRRNRKPKGDAPAE